MTDLTARLLETAELAARRAGKVVRDGYGLPHTVRQKKGPRDLVTETDRDAQEAALEVISRAHPDHTILAEEAPQFRPDSRGIWPIPDGVVWAVDPLDGTTNYTTDLPMVCVSVGVALDGHPVAGAIYDPLRDEMFLGTPDGTATLNGRALPALQPTTLMESTIAVDWSRGQRTRDEMVASVFALSRRSRTLRALGSAALALAYVAAGRVQVYMNFGLQPWDTAAGAAIIKAAGGQTWRPDGTAWRFGEPGVLTGHPDVLAAAVEALRKA